MRAIAGAGTDGHDPATLAVVEATKKAVADLDGYAIENLTDDLLMAELVGRLKALVGVLVSVIER
ncbi:MAG: hypothetical protein GEV03_13575 [Streptosporangiales bacterium]|nr:hypothetical protein [Streptosporangiales bacterium]